MSPYSVEQISKTIIAVHQDIRIRMDTMHRALISQGSQILERCVKETPPPATTDMNIQLINLGLQCKMHWDDAEECITQPLRIVDKSYLIIAQLRKALNHRAKTP